MTLKEWMEEVEALSTRSERFLDDVKEADPVRMQEWMRTAWDLGFNAGRKDQMERPF